MEQDKFSVFVPTRWMFGKGQLSHLHEQPLPGKKAMIIISGGKSTRENGYLARTEEELHLAGVETAVFDKVQANPVDTAVMEGARAACEYGADFLVALGGGSVMDCAKAIALMATNPGDLWDYVFGGTGKRKRPEKDPLPMVDITTTAGTGSEVDCCGVITKPSTHEKIAVAHPGLFPVLSIVDPELMASVPPEFTAYQGFDALFHSTECYISTRANLMSHMVASTAIKNIGKYLARAVRDGKDMEAREHVAFANTMSGYSMVTGSCTSEHSLEHAMSAYHEDLPHGAGLIMISRAYYQFFIDLHCCDDRFVDMARLMGYPEANKPQDFITALVRLQKACGVDNLKMSDYGITPDEFEAFAQNAKTVMGGLFKADPAALSEADCIAIYKASYK
ncbi:MAG: iron-containing alcohol dehydrogenase [Dialister sp.]|nr:iron-containing alcohol dehydrogenase [Dialister sp.]